MKRTILIILCLLTVSAKIYPQEKQWNMIKNDKAYLWGEGYGATEAEADKNALADLISKISVKVTNDIKTFEESNLKNGKLDESSQYSQSVNTYSTQTLNNTVQYKMGKAPEFKVGRAIRRSEIEKMFSQRIGKARDMIQSALRAERKGRVDDALRNYYWALTLLKSVQYPDAEKYTDATGVEHVMVTWIKEQMENVFDDVRITAVCREGDDVDVDITYKDKPVSSASFTYYDGRQWSPIVTACDGFAKLEFVSGYSPKTYQLRLEYQYKNEAKTDKELESVLAAVNVSEFRRSEKTVKGLKISQPMPAAQEHQAQSASNSTSVSSFTSTNPRILKAPSEVTDKTHYQNIVTAVEAAIRRQSTVGIEQYFTAEGWDVYKRLVQYGSAKLVGTPVYKFYQGGEYVTVRGLLLSFSFKNGVKKSFVEEVIFSFDKDKKICNVSFGLGKTAEDDILNKGVWDQNARIAIMNFLENYKTAYALKRYDYIKSIFDDDAIIIVGNIVKKQQTQTKDIAKNRIGGDIVKYNRYSKDQYLNNLKQCFASQEFINIHFSNNDIVKANKEGAGEVYGIQLEQDYYSATYGDHGYLFLYVDMNDPKSPLIKIRTWQPTKNPDLGPSGIYSIADF